MKKQLAVIALLCLLTACKGPEAPPITHFTANDANWQVRCVPVESPIFNRKEGFCDYQLECIFSFPLEKAYNEAGTITFWLRIDHGNPSSPFYPLSYHREDGVLGLGEALGRIRPGDVKISEEAKAVWLTFHEIPRYDPNDPHGAVELWISGSRSWEIDLTPQTDESTK